MVSLPFDVLWKDNGAAKGLADIAAKTNTAAAAAEKLAAEQTKLAAAERKVADAAGQVKIAEAKLEGIRNNAKATAVQRLTAEERLAASQRRLVGAQREVATATTRVAAAHRQVGAQVQQTTKQVESSTSKLRVLGKVGGSSLKVVGVGAAAAVGGFGLLAAGLGKVAGYGLEVASANEQASISFGVMLGSGKKAEAFLTKLKGFAAATPFEFPELQRAASSLISVGVHAGQVIPIMRTLGNVTSGMGTGSEGVQRATIALQQMSSAGRITAEDLNQLRDAGIPLKMVFKAISAETGESTKKLMQMYQTGKLGKKEFEGLMKALADGKGFERFNGLMDKQSKSLKGMLSTLKDTFGQGLADSLSGFFPFIKGAVGSVTIAVGKFFQNLQTHQESAVNSLTAVGNAVLGLGITFVQLGSSALKVFADIATQAGLLMANVPGYSAMSVNLLKAGAAARTAADSIGNELLPKLTAAQEKWVAFGKDQAGKAAMRDAIMKTTLALEKVGHAANGSQIELKHWADRNKLGASESGRLEKQVKSAKAAFQNQISVLKANGAGHKTLAAATDNARGALAKEFRQMGIGSKEAANLARKILGIPKKHDTDIKADPSKAKSGARAAQNAINGVHGKTVHMVVKWTSSGVSTNAPGGGLHKFGAYGGLATTKGMIRRAGGGPVPGYSPHAKADNIPAMLTADEYVQPVSAVRRYGVGAMDAIRTGAVPPSVLRGYASGGSPGGARWSNAAAGGGNTYILNAPNYLGTPSDLRQTLVNMARRGELQVLTR